MAGLAKVSSLKMKEHHYELLSKLSREYKRGVQQVKRIKILLKGSDGQSNYSISKDLGVTVKTVEKWRLRWDSSYEELLVYQQGKEGKGVSDSALIIEMLKRVKDLPRSGKPCRISLSQKKQIVALACRSPSEYGLPFTEWTSSRLAEVAKSEKIVKTISGNYVREILKKSGRSSS